MYISELSCSYKAFENIRESASVIRQEKEKNGRKYWGRINRCQKRGIKEQKRRRKNSEGSANFRFEWKEKKGELTDIKKRRRYYGGGEGGKSWNLECLEFEIDIKCACGPGPWTKTPVMNMGLTQDMYIGSGLQAWTINLY